jgi:TolB-like protein/tetratricopeptide (TPR) repeat protein
MNQVGPSSSIRLDSWKEIASYLKRGITTVQRWERTEGLPVHRHVHSSQSSVYAYPDQLDAWLSGRRIPGSVEGAEERPLAGASVAVLPMVNMSCQRRDEYFSDGITEELINALARIPGLRVAARTSVFRFKGKAEDVRSIGQKLRVSTILEGSMRRSNSRLRVTVRLVKASDGCHIWSATYDREIGDVFAVQDEITASVAAALRPQLGILGSSGGAQRNNQDLKAYDLILEGRFHARSRSEEGLRKAIQCFERAIDRNPACAPAHAGLAYACTLAAGAGYGSALTCETLWKAKRCAVQAVSLDDSLAEAHASLGFIRFRLDWDWPGAEQSFRRALHLDPDSASSRHYYSLYLAAMGRFVDALAQIWKAQLLDPSSAILQTCTGRILHFGGHYESALAVYSDVGREEPTFAQNCFDRGLTYLQLRLIPEALDDLNSAFRLSGGRPILLALIGNALAQAGEKKEARRILRQLGDAALSTYYSSLVLTALGERSKALDMLELAFEERFGLLVYLKVEPLFRSLRSEPRFQSLLRKMNLHPAEQGDGCATLRQNGRNLISPEGEL